MVGATALIAWQVGTLGVGEWFLYLSAVGLLIALVWKVGRSLDRIELNRRRAGGGLAASEDRYRTLVERLPGAAVVRFDQDLRIQTAQGGAIIEEGWTEADFVGKRFSELVEPDRAAVMEENYRRVLAGEIVFFEYSAQKSGRLMLTEAAPVRDEQGRITGGISVGRDISVPREAERDAARALRESEQRYRYLIESTSEWIWTADLEGVLTYSNPAVEKILGYRPDRLPWPANFELLHSHDADRLRADHPALLEAGQGWSDVVARWRHRDGTYRWLESLAIPMWDRDGNQTGYSGIERDITERIRTEREGLRPARGGARHRTGEERRRCDAADPAGGL